MEEKLFKLIEQLAADLSIIKQDAMEIKYTVTKLEENEEYYNWSEVNLK